MTERVGGGGRRRSWVGVQAAAPAKAAAQHGRDRAPEDSAPTL